MGYSPFYPHSCRSTRSAHTTCTTLFLSYFNLAGTRVLVLSPSPLRSSPPGHGGRCSQDLPAGAAVAPHHSLPHALCPQPGLRGAPPAFPPPSHRLPRLPEPRERSSWRGGGAKPSTVLPCRKGALRRGGVPAARGRGPNPRSSSQGDGWSRRDVKVFPGGVRQLMRSGRGGDSG